MDIKNKVCIIPEIYFIDHKDEDNSFKGNIKNDKNSLPFSSYWYFPNRLKKVDPSNGIKTGGNVKDMDKIDFLRVKISNYDLCEKIFNLLLINNKKEFKNYIIKIEKILLNKNKEDLDYYDIISSLINKDYIKIKSNLIDENSELKDFIGKKRNSLYK